MKRGRQVTLAILMAICSAWALRAAAAQNFVLTGYENITGSGTAHLILTIDPCPEEWSNFSLRIEMDGPTTGVLIYPRVDRVTDLGYLALRAGNYTVDVYVLRESGPVVENYQIVDHETLRFEIPPKPPQPERKKWIDRDTVGYIAASLFVIGLFYLMVSSSRSEEEKETRGEGL